MEETDIIHTKQDGSTKAQSVWNLLHDSRYKNATAEMENAEIAKHLMTKRNHLIKYYH